MCRESIELRDCPVVAKSMQHYTFVNCSAASAHFCVRRQIATAVFFSELSFIKLSRLVFLSNVLKGLYSRRAVNPYDLRLSSAFQKFHCYSQGGAVLPC